MKVIVASQNPVKIAAVQQAFQKYFGPTQTVEVIPIEAPSGVREQPMDVRETAEGAINRAENVLHHDVDFVVGIEGGLSFVKPTVELEYGFEQTWACVVDKKRNIREIASGPAFPIPHNVLAHMHAGKNLTDAMAVEYSTEDLGKKEGYNGWLSGNHIDRQNASHQAVFLALCGLMKEEYQNGKQ